MSLVIANNLGLSFGPKVLLHEASFTISPTDRIGLVGANGTGKSTLLKVLTGRQPLDTGTLTFRRGTHIGYLPQELTEQPGGPLVDAVLASVPGRTVLDSDLAAVEKALETETNAEAQLELAQSLADLHERIAHFDEHYGRHRAESLLTGLGFRQADFSKPVEELSGGWRMRAALASLLLQDPDLLLLDEPTNHLDLPTLAWFDGFMRRMNKALVLISHDREFLNRQISRVISLEVEGLRTYVGNYDTYQRVRAEELEQLLARAERQAARRAEMEEFINRFRAKATKARQVQSHIKLLEKQEVVQVAQERKTLGFSFPEVAASGREVATFRGVSKAWGHNRVYSNLNATLLRGQRVAVVGLNGAGKTTLLRLLAGEIEPDEGTVTLGHGVVMGYYAQHHADTLDTRSTILDELWKLVPAKPQEHVRRVAGAFLFSGDDVDKPIRVLSGGERARVALARLLLRPANLLVMDEPTNHLDLDSSEALIDALSDYGGTLIFVSHNRSFLNQLATHVWDVRDGAVVPYPGNLEEYLAHLDAEQATQVASASATGAPVAPDKASRKRLEAEARQARSARTAPLKKKVAELEKRIAQLEAAQKEREAQLSDAAFAADFSKARPVLEAHRADAAELEEALAEWESAGAELQSLES